MANMSVYLKYFWFGTVGHTELFKEPLRNSNCCFLTFYRHLLVAALK